MGTTPARRRRDSRPVPGTTVTRASARGPGRRPAGLPDDEGGFMIVLALLVLFGLTIMGMTAIMSGNIETRIAANDNAGNRAFYAADTGLIQAIASLNNGSVTLTAADFANAAWVYPDSSGAEETVGSDYFKKRLLANRTHYLWRMHFKVDSLDQDGDGDTAEVVYFNQLFNYPSSLYSGAAGDEGYPVIEVLSNGYTELAHYRDAENPGERDAERRLALEIGRNHYNVKVEGAITARSNVNLSGSIAVDGTNHDINGDPGGSCGSDMPGVFMDTGKVLDDNQDRVTGACPAGWDCDFDDDGDYDGVISEDGRPLPSYPWEVLGLEEGDLPAPLDPAVAPTENLSGLIYVSGDIDVGGTAAGQTAILIVHNPLFDAVTYECSVVGSATYQSADPADGCFDVGGNPVKYDPKLDSGNVQYDAVYKAAREPAKYANHGNDIFRGVVIADMVDKINGTADIIGAVISLTSVDASHFGNGAATIKYSCEAINQSAKVGYATRLVWRRL